MLTIAPIVSGFIMARIASGLLSIDRISGLVSAIARSCGFEFMIVCSHRHSRVRQSEVRGDDTALVMSVQQNDTCCSNIDRQRSQVKWHISPRMTTTASHACPTQDSHLHESWLPHELLHHLLHARVLHRLHHAIEVGRSVSAAEGTKAKARKARRPACPGLCTARTCAPR